MGQTLEISDEQYQLLQSLAREHGETLGEAIDRALHAVTSPDAPLAFTLEEEATLAQSPLFQIAGLFDEELPIGWADRHDEVIAEEALRSHAEER